MSNALGVIIGLVVAAIGVVLLVLWWSPFVQVLMGVVPVVLIVGGAAALAYFISEIKARRAMEDIKPVSTETEKK